MPNRKVVLDTNCLLASLSKLGKAYTVWKSFQEGRYTLCVSTEILEEYEEIIAQKTTQSLARNVVDLIVKSPNVEQVNTYFHWGLISADPDDNKFVDCAFAAGATYIVSDDTHFNILRDITFPHLLVLKLKEFLETLQGKSEQQPEQEGKADS